MARASSRLRPTETVEVSPCGSATASPIAPSPYDPAQRNERRRKDVTARSHVDLPDQMDDAGRVADPVSLGRLRQRLQLIARHDSGRA